jgi:parvulin-like peptidyl-prolyl cis-trans isomerase-like protein
MRAQLAKLLREPLVHFLVLGAVLLALFGVRDDRPPGDRQRISVGAEQITRMSDMFERTWQRPPTQQEMKGLIEDLLREEIFYREALVMHLDRDDTVIRRRLRQKMEFVGEDLAAQGQPTDEELTDLLTRRADNFRTPPSISFEQVFVSSARRGAEAPAEAERVLASLKGSRGADLATIGDASLLEAAYDRYAPAGVAGVFGEEFARAVFELPLAQWSGPVRSTYGLHLVRVRAREDGRVPRVDEVHELLVREHQAEKRRESIETLYRTLRDRYEIVIERPAASVQ